MPPPLSRSIRPSCSSMRRGRLAAMSRSWVMTQIVVPSSACSSRSRSRIDAPVALSRLPVGSSARTRSGRPTRARAIATRWRSPPDSVPGRWVEPVRRARPVRAPRAAARRRRGRAIAAVEQPVGDVVERRLATEQEERLEDEPDPPGPERRQLAVGHRRRCRGRRSGPCPRVGRSSVPRMCRSVDLPEPDGPTIPISSPRSMRRSTLAQAPRPAGSPG